MNKVRIKRNNSGDSRTAKGVPTFEEFHNANQMHINDVERTMSEVAWEILRRGEQHDITKTVLEKMFYRDMVDTIENGTEFTDGQWAKIHYFDSCERHHLHRHVPDDVNLIDVIEMICDCVCAGKARSEKEYVDVVLNIQTLLKAYENTVNLINDIVILEEQDDE